MSRTREHARRLLLEPLEERALLSIDYQSYHVVYDPAVVLPAAADGSLRFAAAVSASPIGMTPQQIRTAYGINSIGFGSTIGDGSGQTIAIIGVYDAPNLVGTADPNFLTSDLHKFDVQFGLPDPPSFVKLNQTGGTTLPTASGSSGWSVEASLDVEWAHAIAPKANIILFEANSTSEADMISAAVETARNWPGVTVISMSFGRDESTRDASLVPVFTTPAGHAGVTFLAATGDDGSPGGFPAFAPNVVAVGGTTLTIDSSTYAWVSETAYANGGGGQSVYEAKASYQNAVNGTSWRQIPDVSFDAAPVSGVAVYDSYDFGSTPWAQIGGTSVSAPCWSGLVAIADQLRTSAGLTSLDGASETLPFLYTMRSGDFHDIVSGSNGDFSARTGYDEVTGIGSPIANKLVPDFIPILPKGTATFSSPTYEIGSSPSVTVDDLSLDGNSSCTVTLSSSAGDSETVALAAVGNGAFNGSIVTASGSATADDGILQVVPGGTITVTYRDADDGTHNPATVIQQATMYRLGHYGFSTVPSGETAGVALPVTVTAYDTFNNPISGYNGVAALTASDQGGAISISPSTITLVSGAWIGNVTVNGIGSNVVLRVDNGAGVIGTSNSFATHAGPVASFQWGTIASPERQNVPFPVTAIAKDANGYAATDFNGTAAIGGSMAIPSSGMLLGEPTPSWSANSGEWTLGYSFTPRSTILVTAILYYFGDRVSIWTDTGTLVASQAYCRDGDGWAAATLPGPVQLVGGMTYRIGCHCNDGGRYRWDSTSTVSALGTLGQEYYTAGDGFPTRSGADTYWAVDLKATVAAQTPVTIAPTQATFVNGVWTGSVTVTQAVNGMHLNVDDGNAHSGYSNIFDVAALPWITATFQTNANEKDGVINGALSIPSASTEDLVVSLTSTAPNRVSVPATITIPAGQTTVSLPLTVIDNTVLDGLEAVAITSSAAGFTPFIATINIHDDETSALTVILPSTALEGAGLLLGAGSITASAAPSHAITIHLTSSNPTEVMVPATVILPAGETEVHFDVTIGHDGVVNGVQTAVVAAHVENWTDASATMNVYNTDVMGLGGDWHTLGNGPSHTGYFPGTMGNTPLASLLWSVTLPDNANQIAIGGGRVYASYCESFVLGGIMALDEATGAQLWSYSIAQPDSVDAPTYDNGHVYLQTKALSANGQLWSFDAADGTTTWSSRFACQSDGFLAPTVADGKVFIDGGTYGGMYGFDQPSGAQLFFSNEPHYDEWTPSYYNAKVYTWVGGEFEEHNPTTGAVKWSVDVPWGGYGDGEMRTASAIDNNKAFLRSNVGLYAIDLNTHAQLWAVADTGFSGSPAVQGDTVYAVHGYQVRAYDVTTGVLKGTFDAGQTLIGQPIVTDDALIVASSAKTFLVRRSDYKLLNSIAAGGQISLADNTVFIAPPLSGNVYAYRLSSLPSLALSLPTNVTEVDGAVTGTLSILSAPFDSDVVIALTSSDPARIAVPLTVTIPAGQTSVPLSAVITDDALLNGTETVSITASLSGYNDSIVSMTIHDNETAALTMSLLTSAQETAGVLTGAGVITASKAPDADITIRLSSSDTTGLTVPETVVLHAGQTAASFNVTMVDDYVIHGDRAITVTAQADNWAGDSATLMDLEGDAVLTVTLPTSGWEGQTFAGAGTVQLGGTLTTPLTVSLTSGDPTELSVPATVIIPAGQRSTTFNVALLDNGLCTGPVSEQITASATGFTSGADSMVVNDSDVDHYVFSTINGPELSCAAFSVSAGAYDRLNNLIMVYNGKPTLSASGSKGSLPISTTSVTFASGTWRGNVAINAADPTATLRLANGAGAIGVSNAFVVKNSVEVVSMSFSPSSMTPGTHTLDVTFSEPIKPSSLYSNYLQVSGIAGATVSGGTLLTGNTTARFTLNVPAEGTLIIKTGTVTDVYNYPGGAFTGYYDFDVDTQPFPVPLAATAPAGSLIYSGSTTGIIGTKTDTDSLTISLNAGQTLTTVVRPSSELWPSVQVLDPNGTPIALATGLYPGRDAVIQTVPVSISGLYTIVLGSADATIGTYTASVCVNALEESENHYGVSNNTFAGAQDLTGSFLSLGNPALGAQRGALVGRTDDAGLLDYYAFTVSASEIDSLTLTGLAAGTVNLALYNSGGTLVATGVGGANLPSVISSFNITTPGVYYACVTGALCDVPYSLVVMRNAALDAEPNDSLATAQSLGSAEGVLGSIAGGEQVTLNAVYSGWWDSTGYHSSANRNYSPGLSSSSYCRDFFVFDLTSVTQTVAGARLNIYNPSNGFRSSDTTETYAVFDVSTSIAGLEASGSGKTTIYDDLGSGACFATQTMSAANNGQTIAIPLNASAIAALNAACGSQFAVGGALTTISGTSDQCMFYGAGGTETRQLVLTTNGPDDWYSMVASTAGDTITLATSTPFGGTGQPSNNLAPLLELYDPSGTKVADGIVGPDGRNQNINYVATTPGVYYVRVHGANGTAGEYYLNVKNPLAISLPADVIEGDGSASGTLSIPSPLDSDLIVCLTSAAPARISVPATAMIAAGQTSVQFPLTIIDDSLLNGPEAVSINARATGHNDGVGVITIHDDETATLSVSLPSSASEGDGLLVGVGKITASAVSTRDIVVQLVSVNSRELAVPATVILPAGQTKVTFNVTVGDDSLMDGAQVARVIAHVDNWTDGSATMNVLDNDCTMSISLPASGWEGQTLTGAGTLLISGTLTSELVVSLSSADSAELTMPATVTIPHGQTSATFDVVLHSNGLRQGPQSVGVTATATGLPTVNASMVVNDADVDHLAFDTISGPQTDNVPFSATVRAYDIQNNQITVYNGAVALSATGLGGVLAFSPTSATFTSGAWSGNITVNAADPTVTLHAANGQGIACASNVFAVQVGPVVRYQWQPLPTREYQNVAFPVAIRAVDVNGYLVDNYNGTAALTGYAGFGKMLASFDVGPSDLGNYTSNDVSRASISGAAAHDGAYGLQVSAGTPWTYRNDAVTHVQQGDAISVWMKSTTNKSGQACFGFGATSTGTLAVVMSESSSTLRLQYYSANYTTYNIIATVSQTWLANHWYHLVVSWQLGGTIVGRVYDSDGVTLINTVTATNTNITTGGIGFSSSGSTKYFDTVSKGTTGGLLPISIAPASITFINGVWTGNVVVNQATPYVHLNAADGVQMVGDSTTFNVRAETAPAATVSLDKHALNTNDVLTATATKSDVDGDAVVLTYVWRVNGTVKRTFTSATALSDSFTPSAVQHGDVVTVEVTPDDGAASGATVADSATVTSAAVTGRYVFYNHSYYDGNDPTANAADDKAIAADKTALLPGQTATFANYTSYSRGINGVMVDIAGVVGPITAADFEFKIGISGDPSDGTWTAAPVPTVTWRLLPTGDVRATLIWGDNAIQKKWLQVKVLATVNTRLASPDVFYFGNAIGESGESTANAWVNSADAVAAGSHTQVFTRVAITSHYDYNRDGMVNATDSVLAGANTAVFDNALQLIAPIDNQRYVQLLMAALGSSGSTDSTASDTLLPASTPLSVEPTTVARPQPQSTASAVAADAVFQEFGQGTAL